MSSVSKQVVSTSDAGVDVSAVVSNTVTIGLAWFAFLISVIMSSSCPCDTLLPEAIELSINQTLAFGDSKDTGSVKRQMYSKTGGSLLNVSIPLASPVAGEIQVSVRSFVSSADENQTYPGQFFAGDVVAVVDENGNVCTTPGVSALGVKSALGEHITVGSRISGFSLVGGATTVVNVAAKHVVLLNDKTGYEDGAASMTTVVSAAVLPSHLKANDIILISKAATANLPLLASTMHLGGEVIALVDTLQQQETLLRVYPELHINQVIALDQCGKMNMDVFAKQLASLELYNKDIQKRVDIYSRNAAANGPSLGKTKAMEHPSAIDHFLSVALPLALFVGATTSYIVSPVATKIKSTIFPYSSKASDLQSALTRAFVAIEAKLRGKTLANFASISQVKPITGSTSNVGLTGRTMVHNTVALTISGVNYAVLSNDSVLLHSIAPFLAPKARVYSNDEHLINSTDPSRLTLTKALYQPGKLFTDTIDSQDILGFQKQQVESLRAPLYELINRDTSIAEVFQKTRNVKLYKTKPVEFSKYPEKVQDMHGKAGLIIVNNQP